MFLFQSISIDDKLKAVNGKQMNAINIFTATIRYLKNEAMSSFNRNAAGIMESDVRFVINIPSVWNDNGKKFMSEAALQVCIPT